MPGIDIKVEVDVSKLNRMSRATKSEIMQALLDVFGAEGKNMVRYMRSRYLTGGTSSTRLRSRSGDLVRSLQPLLQKVGTTVTTGVRVGARGKARAYASVHMAKRGTVTTISAKRTQYLAIPLGPVLDQRGVARGGPRDYTDTFVIRSRRGNLLIVQKSGDGITPLFLLRKSVRIKARVDPEVVAQAMVPKIIRSLDSGIQRYLRRI